MFLPPCRIIFAFFVYTSLMEVRFFSHGPHRGEYLVTLRHLCSFNDLPILILSVHLDFFQHSLVKLVFFWLMYCLKDKHGVWIWLISYNSHWLPTYLIEPTLLDICNCHMRLEQPKSPYSTLSLERCDGVCLWDHHTTWILTAIVEVVASFVE